MSKYYVNSGVYIFQREALRAHLSDFDYLDVPDLLLKILADNGNVVCFEDNCICLDIGRPDDMAFAQKMFAEDRDALLAHV